MKTVAVIVQDGFAPFEFGVACEAFGLDRTDDGIPNFDFRIVAPDPGVVQSKLGFSINVENDLTFAYEADLVVVSPTPREWWGRTDPRVLDVVRHAAARRCVAAQRVQRLVHHRRGRRAGRAQGDDPLDVRRHHGRDVSGDRRRPRRAVRAGWAHHHERGHGRGLDACLHLLRQELGAEMTNTIARRMVVPPQRDGGQAQFILRPLPEASSMSLAPVTRLDAREPAQRPHGRSARREGAHVAAHLRPPLQGRSRHDPAAWLGRQRIIQAQRLLEQTDLGLDRIAYECGFGSASVLRQNFARVLGTTPTAYRATFCCEIGTGGSALERRAAELAGTAA